MYIKPSRNWIYTFGSMERVRWIGLTFLGLWPTQNITHVAFDESKPQETEKGSLSSFDVSGIVTEDLFRDGTPNVYPPKKEGIKDGK